MGAARAGGRVIAAAPEAGAEIGVLSGFGLALLSLIMWMVLRGLRGAWSLTFGAVLQGLADALNYDKAFVHIHFGGPLTSLNHRVLNAIEGAAEAYEQAAGYWFHASARLQGWVADETWKLSRDTFHFGSWLLHTHVPKYVRWAIYAAFPPALLTKLIHHGIAAEAPKVERAAHAAAHAAVAPVYRTVTIPHLAELQWLHRHWKAVTSSVAAAGAIALAPELAIPRVWHGIDELRHRYGQVTKRLGKVEALAGATAMAIAMANVLGIPNPRCLRDGPLGKVSRALCGVPTRFLNDLLGLLADFFILENICTVLPLLEEGASVVGTPLIEALTAVGAGLCAGASPPARLRGPAPSIPAVIFGVSAAGV